MSEEVDRLAKQGANNNFPIKQTTEKLSYSEIKTKNKARFKPRTDKKQKCFST